MGEWGSARAGVVLAALLRIGWNIARQRGSHRVLVREGFPNLTFAFHDGEEIGPRMLARIAKGPAGPRLSKRCSTLPTRSWLRSTIPHLRPPPLGKLGALR